MPIDSIDTNIYSSLRDYYLLIQSKSSLDPACTHAVAACHAVPCENLAKMGLTLIARPGKGADANINQWGCMERMGLDGIVSYQ